MKRGELAQLAEIAALIADRELAALAALRADVAALARRADELARPAAQASPQALDPASLSGAGDRWDRWRQEELRRVQTERARLAAAEETARSAARRAFGRQVALSDLAKRAD